MIFTFCVVIRGCNCGRCRTFSRGFACLRNEISKQEPPELVSLDRLARLVSLDLYIIVRLQPPRIHCKRHRHPRRITLWKLVKITVFKFLAPQRPPAAVCCCQIEQGVRLERLLPVGTERYRWSFMLPGIPIGHRKVGRLTGWYRSLETCRGVVPLF